MTDLNEETELRNLPDSMKVSLSKLLDKEGVYEYQGSTGTQQEWKTLMAHIPEFMPVMEDNIISGKRKYRAEHIQLIEDESRRRGVPAFKLLLGEWGTSGRKRPKIKDLIALLTAFDMRRALTHITMDVLKYDVSSQSDNDLARLLINMDTFKPKVPDLRKDVQDAVKHVLEEKESAGELMKHSFAPLDLRPDLVRTITNNFNEKTRKEGGNRLDGNGTFGQVFVGIIPGQTSDDLLHKLRIRSLKYQPYRLEDNITRVAVKRLKLGPGYEQSKKLFDSEIRGLRRLEHPNIIPLLGYCIDEPYGHIVYPLMIGGSLDTRLACKSEDFPIPWNIRIQILQDVAKGLEYIHAQKTPDGSCLVHRDIKSANVLLDENINAKISDFGLLRDGSSGLTKTVVMTQTPCGTAVYMPFEAFRGVVEPSWDIYSLGVIILEILTGLPPIDEENQLLSSYFDDGRLISDLLDKKAGDWPASTVEKIFALSRRCLGEKRVRPTATALLEEINKAVKRVPIELKYEFLKKTTNDFDDLPAIEGGRKLGEGGYGVVYVGTVAHQQDEDLTVTLFRRSAARVQGVMDSQLIRIAVKRFCKNKALDENPKEEEMMAKLFMSEVEAMSRFNHPNLLTLLGYCSPKMDTKHESLMFEEYCLVYPLMVNGSLEDRLQCKDHTLPIPWEVRARILKQVSSAMKYLHTFETKPFIHRDIKSANVLLDEHYFAKIGDFGLVRIGASGNTTGLPGGTYNPAGTTIYMATEAIRGDISAKMDVFSFGVVILEVLTGVIANANNEIGDIVNSPEYHKIESVNKIRMDPKAGPWPEDLTSNLFRIAMSCFSFKQDRPTSTQVFTDLTGNTDYWLGGVVV